MTSRPVRVSFPAGDVAELRRRLAGTRWPDDGFTAEPWSYGVDRAYLRELIDYWADGYDFAAAEDRINAVPNYLHSVDGLDIHYLAGTPEQVTGPPVLLLHGWPGSVVEFLDAIPLLTAAGLPVIAASLQGYGLSPSAPGPGMSPKVMAGRLANLMADLGHQQFVVSGGDWGSLVATHLAADFPDRVLGLHLTIAQAFPPADVEDPMSLVTEEEKGWLETSRQIREIGSGYGAIQSTRPDALAPALNDSPAGWCAWILDKWWAWTDCADSTGRRDLRNAVSWDQFLTVVSMYWFTNTITSSIRLYREQAVAMAAGELPGRVTVPTGAIIFPGEINRSPKAWLERRVPLRRWTRAERGGHFGALEQPQVFAADLIAFATDLP
ncbi:epoxide hydrolase family protein [Granulicoccus phenolivorans]|uniref:epoxide hydrolase family protein n=1 Tax=Granulicoccus phenolivorans TaxID=266854 RepID=UPI0004238672|nr:epoxide hydrolase family protein [Granulicoccus phenolivorans]